MNVTLLGLGGTAETLTLAAADALKRAGLILGARRLLENLPADCAAEKAACWKPEEQLERILARGTDACVVYSGDTGFYSGAKGLIPLLVREHIPYRILPGLSSVQMLSAALGKPWQDWKLASAHGTECDPVCELMDGKSVFFLTGGAATPDMLCRRITEAGLGGLPAAAGGNLFCPDQRIDTGTAAELAEKTFAPLSVLLVEQDGTPRQFTPGLADDRFLRGSVPMTKQEVRAAIPGKLELRETDTVWDVGAGTGSVSAELALTAKRGRTYAVECSPEGCGLIRKNREALGAWNLTVVEGKAPEALDGLPVPDAVFIGGSKGRLEAILDAVLARNPAARICISAIAVETLGTAVSALTARGKSVQVTQIAAGRSRAVGGLHMMTANNPVYLITGGAE